jgi:hypothetical protein
MTAIEVQRLLGEVVFRPWSELPTDVQEFLFEAAVHGRAHERTNVAIVLHDRHPRTAHPPKTGESIQGAGLGRATKGSLPRGNEPLGQLAARRLILLSASLVSFSSAAFSSLNVD